MQIERFDPAADASKTQACYGMYVAGKPADDPPGPLMSFPVFSGWFASGWEGTPHESWLMTGDDTGMATFCCVADAAQVGLHAKLPRHARLTH